MSALQFVKRAESVDGWVELGERWGLQIKQKGRGHAFWLADVIRRIRGGEELEEEGQAAASGACVGGDDERLRSRVMFHVRAVREHVC